MNSNNSVNSEKQSSSQTSEKSLSTIEHYSSLAKQWKDKLVPESLKKNFNENKQHIYELTDLIKPFANDFIFQRMDKMIFSHKPSELGYQWLEIKRDSLLNDYCGIFYSDYREMDITTYDQIMEYINHLISSYYQILCQQDDLPEMILRKNNEKLIQTFKYILNYFLLFTKKVEFFCEQEKHKLDQYVKQYYKNYDPSQQNHDQKLQQLIDNYVDSKNKSKNFKELAQMICKIISRYRFHFYDDGEE